MAASSAGYMGLYRRSPRAFTIVTALFGLLFFFERSKEYKDTWSRSSSPKTSLNFPSPAPDFESFLGGCVLPPACLSKRRTTSGGRVFISLPVYEDMWWLRMLLINYLAFTDASTVIVLHLNSKTPYTREELLCLAKMSPRIWINPTRIAVSSFHGSLFQSHWSNFDYGFRRSTEEGERFSHFVVASANSFLIKSGLEDYVFKHDGSFHYRGMGICAKSIYSKSCLHKVKAAGKYIDLCFDWKPLRDVIMQGGESDTLIHARPEGMFFPTSIMQNMSDTLHAWGPEAYSSLSQVNSFLEEYVFSTWGYLHRNVSEKNYGHGLIAPLTNDHANARMNHTLPPEKINEYLGRNVSFFGFKALSRDKGFDTFGTREFVMSLTKDEIRSRCL
mmetsp:Transcript_16574/g.23200  ORF Transcript_16574/g.23200 Transcript_16574/m.23200 type:complete len:388 (+) Transcript_16574:165-1328(+)